MEKDMEMHYSFEKVGNVDENEGLNLEAICGEFSGLFPAE
jgi:hypothetical protein